ncbi:MAG: hypothetical protein LBB66_00930 [Desulfovibrio sp.]|jgi:hypothetical protein|nr:hypothetical protein [Desulfovibrio sp.]
MRIDNPPRGRLAAYFQRLDERAARSGGPERVNRLDLGTHAVRLVNHAAEFVPHVEKQLAYALKDEAPRHDATLVIWRERDIASLSRALDERCDPRKNPRLRVQKLAAGNMPDWEIRNLQALQVFDERYSRHHPLVNIDMQNGILSAHNPESGTFYYAPENLEPEEFIKQGHIFVQTFNKLLKTPVSGLAHAALVGLNGKGALICARGQRGKSTLAVRALLDGFDYVSDDYLVLGREGDGLYAWPIYSVITLSPLMYGDLYHRLNAKFVSNNARKDKYVFNISGYHDRFVSRHPVSLCLFPQIVPDPEPSVAPCTPAGRGRAVTQLVHSTINQMGDAHDIATVRKLVNFVKDLPFYQISLCRDTDKNLRRLRTFLETGACDRQAGAGRDISSRAAPHAVFAP